MYGIKWWMRDVEAFCAGLGNTPLYIQWTQLCMLRDAPTEPWRDQRELRIS